MAATVDPSLYPSAFTRRQYFAQRLHRLSDSEIHVPPHSLLQILLAA